MRTIVVAETRLLLSAASLDTSTLQVGEPASEYLPVGQAVQVADVIAPVTSENMFAAQAVQTVDVVAPAEYRPAGQLGHRAAAT